MSAMRSKSLSRWSTARLASSAVAAINRSGTAGGPVVSAVGKQLLDLDGAVLNGWCQVLDRHGRQRWPPPPRPQLVAGPGAVADLEPGDGADADQAARDPVGPSLPVGGVAESDNADLSMSQSVTPRPRA